MRRSNRQRRQFVPELHYDATAYMKSPKVAAAVTKVQAPAARATSRGSTGNSLAQLLNAVVSVFSSLKVKLLPSWRRQPIRKRGKAVRKATAAKRSSSRVTKKASL